MPKEFFENIDKKGLIHAYDPSRSVPQQFIDLIKRNGKTTYRSTFLIKFDRFRPYDFFIVLFAEKGSNGQIKAWGIADRSKCEAKPEGSAFLEAKYGLEGNKYSEFKSLFYYLKMGLFKTPYDCRKLDLIKTGKPITSLTSLQTALYVEIPSELMKEISNKIKGVNK